MSERHCYLSPSDLTRLRWACTPIKRAFRHMPYLVGSAMTKQDYRDIDIRLILPDDEFAAMFGGRSDGFDLLRFVNTMITGYIQQASGLSKPIDFQIQPMSHANSIDGTNRNPLGVDIAAGGVDVPVELSNTPESEQSA